MKGTLNFLRHVRDEKVLIDFNDIYIGNFLRNLGCFYGQLTLERARVVLSRYRTTLGTTRSDIKTCHTGASYTHACETMISYVRHLGLYK